LAPALILDTNRMFSYSYVRLVLPKLPEDGVAAIVRHLTSEDLLAHVSFHIGTKDLVLSEASHSFPYLHTSQLCAFI
jgi:hypothetical protein